MLIDTHFHVGQFYDLYFTPQDILSFMNSCGVDYCLISSTTTCERDYDKVLQELNELNRIGRERILSCLWMTEEMLIPDKIKFLFDCDINWKCLKIHPSFDKTEWHPKKDSIKILFDLAEFYNLPVLIHTGYDQDCNSLKYEEIIKFYPYVKVILAHGRPREEAKFMAFKYDNVYIDTAFMPMEDILFLINNDIHEKILWGTDYPIITFFYRNCNPKERYFQKLNDLKNKVPTEIFTNITYNTAKMLFHIE